MDERIIYNCLEQLIKVYVYGELQYMYSAVHSSSPILRLFAKQRALERMDFIEEIYTIMVCGKGRNRRKTYEELRERHVRLYGRNLLNTWIPSEGISIFADGKALEICNSLLTCPLPKPLVEVIKEQTVKLQSGMLSVVYLKALYEE